MKHQQSGLGTRIPTNQQSEAMKRQKGLPPRQKAFPHRVGHQEGLHPEDQPYLTGDMQQGVHVADEYDLEEDDEFYATRFPNSSRRYQQIPDVSSTKGRVSVVEHFHEQPLRAHRPQPQERYTDEVEQIRVNPQHRMHPLLLLGLCMTLFILGWIGLNIVSSWYQGVQNDWTFGKQRHFEINAVVGHNDSRTNPCHFIAENNNGQIIVIELPGGTVSKAKIYQIETVPANAGNPPVKVSFQDMNGDGKPHMLVQIGDSSAMIYLTLYNNGTEFVSKL